MEQGGLITRVIDGGNTIHTGDYPDSVRGIDQAASSKIRLACRGRVEPNIVARVPLREPRDVAPQ